MILEEHTCQRCRVDYTVDPRDVYYSPTFCRDCMYTTEKMCTDLEYFLENHYVIKWSAGKLVYFKLEPHQREVVKYVQHCVDNRQRVRMICMKGRRIGMSELVAGIVGWYTILYSQYTKTPKRVDIYAGSESQALLPLQKVKQSVSASADLRPYVGKRLGKEQKLQKSISFRPVPMGFDEDGNPIEYDEMCSVITAKASGGQKKRGADPDINFYDEAAVVEDDDYYSTSISSTSQDGWEFIVGTPLTEDGFFWNMFERYYYKEDNVGQYKAFYFPTVELTPEGEQLLNRGLHHELRPEHITKIRGINWSTQTAIEELEKLPYLRAMTEVFARVVPSFQNFFPKEIIKPCMKNDVGVFKSKEYQDSDIDHISNRDLMKWVKENYSNIQDIKIGIDWAKKSDETVLTAFAVDVEGCFHMVMYDKWRKMSYDNQYERVKMIYDKFIDPQSEISTVIYCDITGGTQESHMDVLRSKGCKCVGVQFQETSKRNMADVLYSLMQRHKIEYPNDEEILRSLFSVDMKLKGGDGHLDDLAASIFSAVSSVRLPEVFEEVEEMDTRGITFRTTDYRGLHTTQLHRQIRYGNRHRRVRKRR